MFKKKKKKLEMCTMDFFLKQVLQHKKSQKSNYSLKNKIHEGFRAVLASVDYGLLGTITE